MHFNSFICRLTTLAMFFHHIFWLTIAFQVDFTYVASVRTKMKYQVMIVVTAEGTKVNIPTNSLVVL